MNDELVNRVANLCITHYNSLPKTGKPNLKEWTIMCAIVLENRSDNTLKVVSMGTGSKCIGQNKLCPNGTVINDSHAEVICRRSFMRYLYEQIDKFYCNKPSIFSKDSTALKCQLKSYIKFHLFCTQVPCGDAAIFPKQLDSDLTGEQIDNNQNDEDSTIKDSSSQKRVFDINRTGAKCLKTEQKQDVHGEGVNYHVTGVIRTKPGRGDPTLSKSCSDKIARWIRLGIQGAFLTLLIEPIYLESLLLAENVNYSKEALERALILRFANTEESLKSPFKLHIPQIMQSNIPFPHQKIAGLELCPSSIIWRASDRGNLEVAVNGFKQGVTKKHMGTTKARLSICKRHLFQLFIQTVEKHNLVSLINDSTEIDDLKKLTYLEIKTKCNDYNLNWELIKKNIFKVWTNKNHELLNFKAL